MNLKNTLIVTLISFVLFSCNNNNYTEKINSIDKLTQKIDTISKQFILYSSYDFNQNYNFIFEKNKIYGSIITKENINSPLVKKLNKFSNLSKFYKKMAAKKDELSYNLALSKQQLQNLKTDLKNNSIKQDSANKYFKIENKIANDLFLESNEFFENLDKNNKIFNDLKPEITNITDSILNYLKTNNKKNN